MDVAPAMVLLVLLLSPTAAGLCDACPRAQGANRGSHSAILGQPHCRGPAEYRHAGRNSRERHRRHVPVGVPRDDLLPTERWACAPSRWYEASEAGSTVPRTPGEEHGSHSATLVLRHLSGGSVPLYKSPHHTVDATSCTRSCRAGTHSPICLNNFPICVMYARGGRDNGTQGAGMCGSRCMSQRFQFPSCYAAPVQPCGAPTQGRRGGHSWSMVFGLPTAAP